MRRTGAAGVSEHSPVGPSGAARRIQCPASVRLQEQYPGPDDSPAAVEGHQAHLVASELLHGRVHEALYVTDEMRRGAELYVQYVRRLVPQGGVIEQRLAIPRVHEQAFGTPDFWAQRMGNDGRLTIIVVDYKFGFGLVEVFENPQLVDYVSGVLSLTAASDLEVDVIVAVVQPRAAHPDGPVREWRFRASAIRALVNISSSAAHAALGANPAARTGPECLHCTARQACTTLQRAAYRAADLSGTAASFDLTPAQAGAELTVLTAAGRAIEARRAAIEAQTAWHMQHGQSVPGWMLTRNPGRERWTRGDDAVIALAALLGFDLAKPAEAITPKQAAAKGFPVEHVRELVTSTSGAVAVVPDDGSAARRAFGGSGA